MRLGRLARALTIGLLPLALVRPQRTAAQDATPPSTRPTVTSTTVPTPIAAVDIPTRAERTATEIRDWDARLASAPPLDDIVQALPQMRATLVSLTARMPEERVEVSPRELDDLRGRWELARDQLAGWADRLTKRLQTFESWPARLKELDEQWAATEAAAAREALPSAVMRVISTVRTQVKDAQTRSRDERDTVLTIASQVGALQGKVVEGLAGVTAAQARMRGDLLTAEVPPLWQALRASPPFEPLGETVRRIGERNRAQLRDTFYAQRPQFAGAAVAFLLLLAGTLAVRSRASTWSPEDVTLAPAHMVAARPVSAALVVAMFLRWVLLPSAGAYRDVSAILVTAPLLFLLWDRLRGVLRTAVPIILLTLVLSLLWRILPMTSVEARLMLGLHNAIVLTWALWVFQPRYLAGTIASRSHQRLLLIASRIACGLLAVALIADVLGNVSLGNVVTRAVLGSTVLGLLIYETARVLSGLTIAWLHAPGRAMPRAVAYHAPTLRRRLVRVIHLAAWAAWGLGALEAADLYAPVAAAVRDALGAKLEIGALSLSPMDVIAFAITVAVSVLIARIIRALLEDDVLPRMDLPRGVPSAISTAANYTVLLIGFLLALSAAGLDLGRVTILAGAFGVGIGFGLQNVVNNFVSGLILLFERPVRIGDVIEFGTSSGTVRRIGIRSSAIETFDGAEVIVPNAQLIAERVINWTFSAAQRRIEIPVGVAYGSDPGAVLALLERVATAQDDVLRQPPPQALFLGFGASTLDFVVRCWVARYDTAGEIRSRLGIAIHRAFKDASIEIPFPQQELRVRSITTDLAKNIDQT